MAETTAIGWCDATANLWWGCEHVHDGCENCYAEAWAKSKGKEWDRRYEIPGVWKVLDKLQKLAKSEGRPKTVFVGSMMDIFERAKELRTFQGGLTPISTGELRSKFMRDYVPRCPDLIFLLLTKRPSNIVKLVPIEWLEDGWPTNVWTGTSASDQPTADLLLPQLLRAPGPHFASFEPLLGPITAFDYLMSSDEFGPHPERGYEGGPIHREDGGVGLEWVIVGAESGPKRRPCEIAWIRSVADQCRSLGTPVFIKQDSALRSEQQGRIPDELWALKQFPEWKPAVPA